MSSKTVTLQHPTGSSASIELFGAHVSSWKAPDGVERLYMSRKTSLTGPAPIRGGIPICFPFFGPPPTADQASSDPLLAPHTAPELSNLTHGFVRTASWDLVSSTSTSATFSFPSSSVPSTYGGLDIGYTVTLTEKGLKTELSATSKERIKVKMAFHTYHAVSDSDKSEIEGISPGLKTKNNLAGGAESIWQGGKIGMKNEIATVALGAAGEELILHDGPSNVAISSSGLPDVLLWNPKDKAGTSVWSDMEVGDAKRFTCVEPAIIEEWKVLEPGEKFIASQALSVL
ncbi:galactose mutarotase-like domain-containing protein [Naematelia encephala]|uniref:Glucose-6-phosphate 1-epimerase n=1 Tax=Naematelia encephala TaxID=71784 RepID=A0A1Y2AS97_9TREE|nr:galactose mutarotase-like domain-containing protein [Naematelia encephala]